MSRSPDERAGPIEAAWREYVRRDDSLDGLGRDIELAEAHWADAPIIEAARLTPQTPGDWAALVLIGMTMKSWHMSEPVDATLDNLESILGEDANVAMALW